MLKIIATTVIATAWGGLCYSAAVITPKPQPQPRYTIVSAPVQTLPSHPIMVPKNKPTKRKTPKLTEKEKFMLAVAVGEESGVDNHVGKQAMLNVVLNRIGTTKDRVRVKDVLLEENQFSFMWGSAQTQNGRILLGGNLAEIRTLAKNRYREELAFVLSVVNQLEYVDVTGGRTYYYNQKISSPRGHAWFSQNTNNCKKIGEYHTFCHLKQSAQGSNS